MDPLSILPEEMWRAVFNHLTSHKDLQSAQNTCQLWRSLLTGKQTEWMFQGVFPSLEKYLPTSDILNCRRVCKSWKKVVDSNLENGQQSINAPGRHYELSSRKRPRTLETDLNESAKRLKLSTTEALERFKADFAVGKKFVTKNPFVSRALELYIKEINGTVLEFFEKFGVHLYYLELSIFHPDAPEFTPPAEIVKFVWNVLKCVPNLKKLVLQTLQDVDPSPEVTGEQEESQNQEIEQFLQNNLVPPLPQLKNLDLDGNVHKINQVLSAAYAPQLDKFVQISPKEFAPSNLSNLTELVWHFFKGCPSSELNKLKNLGCSSLQRLDIYALNLKRRRRINFSTERLFRTIETFQSTLTHLYIFLEHLKIPFPAHLNLPFVQELCLEIEECKTPKSINFSFLHNLQSLRKLKCVLWKHCYIHVLMIDKISSQTEHNKQHDVVDLHYYLNEYKSGGPYHSNIWRVLPSLDVIELVGVDVVGQFLSPTVIGTKVYSRTEKNEKCIQ